MFRYIRKKEDSFVLGWTPSLAARSDMVECDAQGGIVKGGGGALPRALLDSPIPVTVPVVKIETPVLVAEAPALVAESPEFAPVSVRVDLDAMPLVQLRAYAKANDHKIDMRLNAVNTRKAIREAMGDF